MKTIDAKSKIGAGLFTDDTLEVNVNFESGERLVLEVLPLTQDMIVGLELDGVKFENYANNAEAFESGSKILDAIVASAKYISDDGAAKPLDGKYKHRILQLPDVMAGIFEAATEHGAQIAQDDEKNSES